MAEGQKQAKQVFSDIGRALPDLLRRAVTWATWIVAAAAVFIGLNAAASPVTLGGKRGLPALLIYLWHHWKLAAFSLILALVAIFVIVVVTRKVALRWLSWFFIIAIAYLACLGAGFVLHIVLRLPTHYSLLQTYLLQPVAGAIIFFIVFVSVSSLRNAGYTVADNGPSVSEDVVPAVILIGCAGVTVTLLGGAESFLNSLFKISGIHAIFLVAAATAFMMLFASFQRKAISKTWNTTRRASFFKATGHLLRKLLSLFDAILADQLAPVVARWDKPVIRFSIIAAVFAISCAGAVWFAAGVEFRYAGTTIRVGSLAVLWLSMTLPVAVSVALWRRTVWLDKERDLSLVRGGVSNSYWRWQSTNDLHNELLFALLLLFTALLPTALFVLNQEFKIYQLGNQTLPNWQQWVGWTGNQFLRDLPWIQTLGDATQASEKAALTPASNAPPVSFYVRVIAEITVIGVFAHIFGRLRAETKQWQQFEDSSNSVDRLDFVSELELFRTAEKSWLRIERMKRYDPSRLEIFFGNPAFGFMFQEAYGASKIAGYQFAASAIMLFLSRTASMGATSLSQDVVRQFSRVHNDIDIWGDLPSLIPSGPRTYKFQRECASRILEGLDKKLKLLGDLAPDIGDLRTLLEAVADGRAVALISGLHGEIAAVREMAEIEAALHDRDSENWEIRRDAGEKLDRLLHGKVDLCVKLAKDSDINRSDKGIAILGSLGPSLEHERILLEILKLRPPTFNILRALAKIGSSPTFDALAELQAGITSRYLLTAVIPAMAGVANRQLKDSGNSQPAESARRIFIQGLAADVPAWKRRCYLVGLYLVYDASCDDALLQFVEHGTVGFDGRSSRVRRSEESEVWRLRAFAVRMLAQSSSRDKARILLQNMLRAYRHNLADADTIEYLAQFGRRIRVGLAGIDDEAQFYKVVADTLDYLNENAVADGKTSRVTLGDPDGILSETILLQAHRPDGVFTAAPAYI